MVHYGWQMILIRFKYLQEICGHSQNLSRVCCIKRTGISKPPRGEGLGLFACVSPLEWYRLIGILWCLLHMWQFYLGKLCVLYRHQCFTTGAPTVSIFLWNRQSQVCWPVNELLTILSFLFKSPVILFQRSYSCSQLVVTSGVRATTHVKYSFLYMALLRFWPQIRKNLWLYLQAIQVSAWERNNSLTNWEEILIYGNQ